MSGEKPGQAAYERWAEVMATNGVTCEPFHKLGNVEQMAWREAIAAQQPQPAPVDEDAPGGEPTREHRALEAILDEIDEYTEGGPAADMIRSLALRGLGRGGLGLLCIRDDAAASDEDDDEELGIVNYADTGDDQ